jgi:DHA1 family bicyclomycin/chloramphenicol resistance-like MFS transporter
MVLQDHKRQLIILMTLLFFLSQACTDIYVPGLPEMTREFNTTVGMMSLTITVYTYAQAFFFLFTGVISDLFGRRKVIMPGIAIQVIASILIAFNHSISIMIFLRILQAIGSGAIYIVMRLIIKDVMNRDEQVQAVGIFVTALPLSLAVAPVVGAWIIKFLGWRYCFSLIGLVQGALLIWALILIKESNHNTQLFRSKFKLKTYIASYFIVLKTPLFYTLSLVVGGVFASYYGFITISSYMYIDEYHVSSILYSYTFIAIAGFYLLGNQIMLLMNRAHRSSWGLIKAGIIISVIGLVLILLGFPFKSVGLITLSLITAGVILLRMATAFINPPIQVAVTHQFGTNGAQALGLLSSLQYVSAGVGSFVSSILPWAPSTNLIISSLFFCLISFIGYKLCPSNKLA